MRGSDIVLIIIAVIFPPIAALMVGGCCDFLINLCLTLLGFFPGHIHAFWLIYRKMKAEEQYGHSGYTYVGSGHFQPTHGSTAPLHPNHSHNNSRTHLQQPAYPQQQQTFPAPKQAQQEYHQQPQPQHHQPQQQYNAPPGQPTVAPRAQEVTPGFSATMPPAYKD